MKKVSLFILFFSGLATAADTKSKDDLTFRRRLIEKNIEISERIDSLAERIDLFFAGEKLTNRRNETQLRIINYAHKTEYEDFENEIRAEISLRLPNIEENWNIKFSTEDDKELSSLESHRAGAPPRRARTGVSLGLAKKLGDFDVSFRPGIKIKDPIETSHVLVFKNELKWDRWNIIPKFDFFADSVIGTGQSISLGFNYELNRSWVFTWTNEEKYFDLDNLFSTLHGPGLLYLQSDKIGYSATFLAYSTNDPTFHLENYTLTLSRREEIWRRILYYSITPSWRFEKEDNFKHVADLALQIDLIF